MKRRFQFRLARLARVRAVEEKVARAAWATSEADARGAEDSAAEMARQRTAAQRSVAAGLAQGVIDPQTVLFSQDSVDRLSSVERARQEVARTARWQADRLQQEWQTREADRRALTKLEEQALRLHRAELERDDQAELDEAAGSRHARRTRETPSDSRITSQGADSPVRDSLPRSP